MEKNDQITYSPIFSLKGLFSAPLIAMLDADIKAAYRFVSFIKKWGFENQKGEELDAWDWGQLRFITFSYYKTGLNGNKQRYTVRIPLLSLVPLPILRMSKASFDMELRILGIENQLGPLDIGMPSVGRGLKKFAPKDVYSQIRCALSPRVGKANEFVPSPEIPVASNMRVHIEVDQSDLPAGVIQLLNVAQEANSGKVDDLDIVLVDPPTITLGIGAAEQKQITVSLLSFFNQPIAKAKITVEIPQGSDIITVEPLGQQTDPDGKLDYLIGLTKEAPALLSAKDSFLNLGEPIRIYFQGGTSLKAVCIVFFNPPSTI